MLCPASIEDIEKIAEAPIIEPELIAMPIEVDSNSEGKGKGREDQVGNVGDSKGYESDVDLNDIPENDQVDNVGDSEGYEPNHDLNNVIPEDDIQSDYNSSIFDEEDIIDDKVRTTNLAASVSEKLRSI